MQTTDTLSRTERLDGLRFGPAHKKLLVGSGIGWALDAMDVGLISFIMAALAKEWQLSQGQLSTLASAGFVGMMIGASVGGLLADKIGRRNVFALTLLIYGVATGASALAGGVGVLIALRFIVGLGLGAELPVASTLVAEYAPRHIRGRVVVALESFWAAGWLAAALVGFLVVPLDGGWRWALITGVIPALYAIVVRRHLPESVRYLESRGRLTEAEAAVRSFEKGTTRYEAPTPPRTTMSPDATNAAAPHTSADAEVPAPSGLVGLLRTRSLRGRALALSAVWFFVNLAYYGTFIWLPTLLFLQGHSLVKSFAYTLIITLAQLPGYAAAAYLVEKIGRRATLSSFLVGSALAAAAFGLQTTPTGIMIAGCLVSFFNLGAWGALYAIGPEVFPTAVRATGTGLAAATGRVAGIIAPLLVPPLLAFGDSLTGSLGPVALSGTIVVFAVFAVSFLAASAAVWALPEKTNQDLEHSLPAPTRAPSTSAA
ncbi:MFS transporter [Corynebacterium sp. 13CS0277]|uniref:MFS transporter n=1 Tax=Corynebacterium sp. 13CS0277 TaxID=2071994 RepID=UPI000D034F6C|nr:MFS transporter [Corynebacterium sp. 13CS0277]PRQ12244.1 MFS transporter [Corynebacterium sp. 13CS0277]